MFEVPDKILDMTRISGISPEVKIDMCDNSVLISERVPKFTGRGSGCLPKCSSAATLYMGQKGKAHEVLKSAKVVLLPRKRYYRLCEAVLPPKRYHRLCGAVLPLVHGTAGIRVGLFSCGPNRPCAGKTDPEEACTTSLDPWAQHINQGAELAHGTHQDCPKPCAGTL